MTKRILMVLAVLLLSACAPDTEVQHDGSGSDQMLKSPCACSPVPYQAPGFKWNVG